MLQPGEQLAEMLPASLTGTVLRTAGMTVAVGGFPAPIGAVAEIVRDSGPPVPADVIGFAGQETLLFPTMGLEGVRRGCRVRLVHTVRRLPVGEGLLGRVINARGEVIDGRGAPAAALRMPLDRKPPEACSRPRIHEPLSTGIRAIDGLLTCGRGQRIGVFSGSGVGKSVCLGMMARHTEADMNVIALIGERGREVNEFIERDLGSRGLAKSVVVVATSDEPAVVRVQAALAATTVAEYFRDQGKNVLLLMDSVTRFAMAQREIGLASGEPPTTRGYPPSVFSMLPKLVERAGNSREGSITAFYSVLVEGDDANEPISDTMRGLLDGHSLLSRKLAGRGHYPAIDILESISRLMPAVTTPEHLQAARRFRQLVSVYREHEDILAVGAYRPGGNPELDLAVQMKDELDRFLCQQVDESASVEQASRDLLKLVARAVAGGEQVAARNAAGHAGQQAAAAPVG